MPTADIAPAGLTAPPPALAPAMARVDGAVLLRLARRGPATVVADRSERGSARVRLPRTASGTAAEAVLINTAGGLTDGDRLETEMVIEAGAAATVTTQAAEKIYRSRGASSLVTSRLRVGPGAALAWLPQESILFDGARLVRRLTIDLDGEARFLGCESLVLGRIARGERVTHGAVFDGWRVKQGGRLLWADGFRLDGDLDAQARRPALLDGCRALASVVYVGPDAAMQLAAVRQSWDELGSPARAGVSLRPGLLVMRVMAGSGQLMRAVLAHVLPALRAATGAGPQAMPRVWAC
jgi:urease accessory protein